MDGQQKEDSGLGDTDKQEPPEDNLDVSKKSDGGDANKNNGEDAVVDDGQQDSAITHLDGRTGYAGENQGQVATEADQNTNAEEKKETEAETRHKVFLYLANPKGPN